MRRALLLAALAAPLLLGGCTPAPPAANANCTPNFRATDWADLAARTGAARTLWRAANATNYTFSYRSLGFAPPNVYTVTVRGGAITRVVISNPGPPSEVPPAEFGRYATVDRLFDDLDAWIANRATSGPCYAVEATFDAQYGFPRRVVAGRYDLNIADGVGGREVTDFARE